MSSDLNSIYYRGNLSPSQKKQPIGIIVQARMGSTRLPSKVMLELLPRLTMLEIVLRRLKNCRKIARVVVATTHHPSDEPIAKLATELGFGVFRGSEDDVLSRYYGAACKYGFKTIVRVTSDCPAIEPELIDLMIGKYLNTHYDYLSNILDRTFPRGMDAEIFSFTSLQKAQQEAETPLEREHVTAYIYGHPEIFKIGHFKSIKDNHSHYRLTVDTEEDLLVARKVFAYLAVKGVVLTNSYRQVIEALEKLGDKARDEQKQTKYESSDYFQQHQPKK